MRSCWKCIIFILCLFSFSNVFAAIDFTFTPIKYELIGEVGTTITKPATLTNNSSDSVTIITGTSDFQSNGTDGTPSFVRRSELVYEDQQLSSWISIDTDQFTISPGENVTINFTIDIPENATPGWHYAAIFFKNPGSETSTGGNIGINVDYGILILLEVEGEKNAEWEVDEENIVIIWGSGSSWTGGGWKNNSSWFDILFWETYDDCPFGDFSRSNFDGKCIDGFWNDTSTGRLESPTELQENPFDIRFDIPFNNTGNTHIKPLWKIILRDEDGNELKAIGKEVIVNELGAVIGEKIVDYLPINDTGGNVLPQTKRIFESDWKGFPYKTFDETGNEIIGYWTPSEYYTRKNRDENNFLMFWQRVREAQRNKTIQAIIDISYTDENGEEVEFNSAREFDISYTEQYIALNPYVVFPLLLIGIFIPLWFGLRFWFLILAKKRKCPKCRNQVRKEWEVCPHCEHILKKHKAKKKK